MGKNGKPVTASDIPVFCAHTEIADVTTLVPNPRNPNKHPDNQIALLAKIIRHQGWRNPIVVSKRSGFITKGHGRLQAAALLQVEKVPVDRQDYENDAAEWADMLADNRIAELAETDNSILGDVLLELDTGAFDMDLTGFDKNALELVMTAEHQGSDVDAEPQISRAAELQKEWNTATGQLWQLGEHRLLCGDSTKAEDVARVMDGEKITCVFTDPPYGVSIGKKNVMLNTFQPSGRCLDDLQMDDMKPDELKAMLLAAFAAWRPSFSDDCSIFVCSPQGGGLGMMMMMMQEACLEVRHILNWVKNSPTFSMGRLDYDYQHEPILFTWTKKHKRNKQGRFQTSLWAVDKPMSSKCHPTMKPVELPENAILNHTDAGDVVADMFCGSGTTIIASERTGRPCRAIEISPGYVAITLQRFKDATGKIPVLLN